MMRSPPTDDTELIAASLVEPARFAELFDRHYPAVHRYLRRRVGPELADDLAAETFTLAFRQRHRYQPERPDIAAWLYGIAGNLLRQHARAEQRRLRAYARVVPDPAGPDVGDGVAERVDATATARRAAAVGLDGPGLRQDRPRAGRAARHRPLPPAPRPPAPAPPARLGGHQGPGRAAPHPTGEDRSR